jgi:Ankyrin repeats (3 copies)
LWIGTFTLKYFCYNISVVDIPRQCFYYATFFAIKWRGNSKTNESMKIKHYCAVLTIAFSAISCLSMQPQQQEKTFLDVVTYDHIKLAKRMIEEGADVNEREKNHKNGWTPLYAAVTYNKVGMTSVLLRNGADIDSKFYDGDTYLHTIALKISCDRTEVTQLLLNAGADVNSKNNKGYTPLALVIERSSTSNGKPLNYNYLMGFVKILLQNGANPFIKTDDGRTVKDIIDYILGDSYFLVGAQRKSYEEILEMVKSKEQEIVEADKKIKRQYVALISVCQKGNLPLPPELLPRIIKHLEPSSTLDLTKIPKISKGKRSVPAIGTQFLKKALVVLGALLAGGYGVYHYRFKENEQTVNLVQELQRLLKHGCFDEACELAKNNKLEIAQLSDEERKELLLAINATHGVLVQGHKAAAEMWAGFREYEQ